MITRKYKIWSDGKWCGEEQEFSYNPGDDFIIFDNNTLQETVINFIGKQQAINTLKEINSVEKYIQQEEKQND